MQQGKDLSPLATRRRRLTLGLLAVVALALATQPRAVAGAWQRVARLLGLGGDPVVAALPVLSDHEIEALRQAGPQEQAVVLLGRAINGFAGSRELIESELENWRGRIELSGKLKVLHTMSMNASDLRVRATGIEIYLAAHDIEKTAAQVEVLLTEAAVDRGAVPFVLFTLGLLAHRGVERERLVSHLESFLYDPDEEVRVWAVEGLAYSGADTQIPVLLEVFRTDPSPRVRERAACSLAQSGMLPWAARWQAVPALLELADDPDLDAQTRKWVFQALTDVTGERHGPDAEAWRDWWSREGVSQQPARGPVGSGESAPGVDHFHHLHLVAVMAGAVHREVLLVG